MQQPTIPHRSVRRLALVAGLLTAAGLLAACGSSAPKTSSASTSAVSSSSAPSGPVSSSPAGASNSGTPAPVETNPPGDIPDTVAYVSWASSDGKTTFVHPEGWTQTAAPGGVMFTDKLNSVTVTSAPGAAPTVAEVQSQVVPTLGGTNRATRIVSTAMTSLPAGPAVRVTWQVNSVPDPVTGKVYRDEVVTYVVGGPGRVVRMDLSGAIGSDNVDPYRKMSQSLVVR